MSLYASVLTWIRELPDHLKIKEMCYEAVYIKLYSFEFHPNRFKTQDICDKAVHIEPYSLEFVDYHLKSRGMRNEAEWSHFSLISDRLKVQKMCTRAVDRDSWDLT